MPYEIKRSPSCPPDKPFGVFKKGTENKVGCHANEGAAKQQLRALYAQEARTISTEAVGEGTFRGRDIFSAAEAVFTQETPESQIRADVVIIKPGMSANRRFYTQEAIDGAIASGFWEGSPMFIDHPEDMRVPTKRKMQSLAAGLSNIRRGPAGEAIGTATFFNREFGKFAMEAKQHVGVSGVHYFKGRRYKGTDNHYYEQVDELLANNSVDFVAFAAAGGEIVGFLPAMESEDDVDFGEITPELLAKIAQERPDLHDTFVQVAGEATSTPPKTDPPNPPAPEPKPDDAVIRLEDVRKMVGEAVATVLTERDNTASERAAVEQRAKGIVDKSGLPEPVRIRLTSDLAARATAENVETLASEAIETAKAEGKAWSPPRVNNAGPSLPNPAAGGEVKPITIAQAAEQSTVVSSFFGSWVNEAKAAPQSGKES